MQHKVRDLVRDWRADDAKKFAIMEVESEAAWPGGGGWQTTPQEMERWLREGDHLGIFATEECAFTSISGGREMATSCGWSSTARAGG